MKISIGDKVEKHTGEARWSGTVVSVYQTLKGSTRYVVEVEPQGFQMIATGEQLRRVELPASTTTAASLSALAEQDAGILDAEPSGERADG